MHTNVNVGGMLATYLPDGAGPHYRLTDWVGTTRAQVNYAGALEQTCQSLPFGDTAPVPCTPATEQFFTGYERDQESGNDYAQARHYASSMGRFMSPDPSGLYYADQTNPQSFNLYSYVLNNPLKLVDPTGLGWCYYGNTDPGAAPSNDPSDYDMDSPIRRTAKEVNGMTFRQQLP